MKWTALVVLALAACGQRQGGQTVDGARGSDGDTGAADARSATRDASAGIDARAGASDAASAAIDAPVGPVTGGPCASGASGATLLRVRIDDVQGQAEVVYEADGTANHAGYAGIYGYVVGFTPAYFDDIGGGGLSLDSHDFVDLTTSTAAISHLQTMTVAIYGRAIAGHTGWHWQSSLAAGQTAVDLVGDTVPYAWYTADVTPAFQAGDGHAFVRIKTLDSQNAIIASRIELCANGT